MKYRIQVLLDQKTNAARVRHARAHGVDIGADVQIGKGVRLIGNQSHIADGTAIGDSANFVFDTLSIGANADIGHSSDIRSKIVSIGKGATLGHHLVALVADELSIGRNAYLGYECEITCRRAAVGEGLYAEHRITMGGGGGVIGPFSELEIGKFVHIGEYSVLNPARKVSIGDYTGLGAHVMIYTHGMWPPALEGYSVSYGPVHIGSKVWLTGRCIVLPDVTIGDGTVVGMGSIVNRDLPAGCIAGGVPAKALRENYYPQPMSMVDKDRVMREIMERYIPELEYKGFNLSVSDNSEKIAIKVDETLLLYTPTLSTGVLTWLEQNGGKRIVVLTFDTTAISTVQRNHFTVFDLEKTEISGLTDALSEDIRDFLRRNCVRFYTPDKFCSIMPPAFRWLKET